MISFDAFKNSTIQESQENPGGNTKTPGSFNSKTQYYVWQFTIPAERAELQELFDHLKEIGKKFKFQLEKGEKTGYMHWQGGISLKTKEYMATVKNLFPYATHLEPGKDFFKCLNYGNKCETRVEGPYDQDSILLQCLQYDQLYSWQKEIVDFVSTPCESDRHIHWYWEKEGDFGKSALSRYLGIKHKADVFENACSKDIAFALNDKSKIVIFDLPRKLEGRVNVTVMEQIKNGHIFSGKYESKTKWFNPMHVLVFANFPPDLTNVSKNRWVVHGLTELKKNSLP